MHEIIKLMHYAKVKDPVFFRIGTSGGIGIEPGSVVISTGAVDEMINAYHEQVYYSIYRKLICAVSVIRNKSIICAENI